MTDRSSGFEWPTRKWITWGLIAILALVALIVVINVIGSDASPDVGGGNPADVEQMEWSIVLTDVTGVDVTLKGDEPFGFPTETWENDFLLERQVQATFEWDVDAELPMAVVDIDNADGCESLNGQLIEWGQQAGQAAGQARKLQAQAFAQHAVNTMRDQACELDLSSLNLDS